ncbi:MAG: DUF2892 domain-containing protein [Methylotenera sp.]
MKANVGGIDKTLRIVAGAALVAWVLFFNGPVWAWVGVVAIATAVINFCPLYSLLGVNTCKIK